MSRVCYLPPENSSRTVDVNSFYETLTTDIYKFQIDGLLFVYGDFNSRCGALEDFICGVDEIRHRDVIDLTDCINRPQIFVSSLYKNVLVLSFRKSR